MLLAIILLRISHPLTVKSHHLSKPTTSVTMALVLFIVILLYHIILQIRGTKQCKALSIELNLLKFKNTDDVNLSHQ